MFVNFYYSYKLFLQFLFLLKASDLKLLQYELEGRIKLLSQSLEKCTKELNEERLNREKIISDRTKEFQIREVNLQKEVEKVQSILEFKVYIHIYFTDYIFL